jgi:hypothetical protein
MGSPCRDVDGVEKSGTVQTMPTMLLDDIPVEPAPREVSRDSDQVDDDMEWDTGRQRPRPHYSTLIPFVDRIVPIQELHSCTAARRRPRRTSLDHRLGTT